MEEIMGMSVEDVVAEELEAVMHGQGIRVSECYVIGAPERVDTSVHVTFESLREAEEFIRLGVPDTEAGPGSLYDRATAACVSLTALAVHHISEAEATGTDPDDLSDEERDAVRAAIETGWTWQVHPNVVGLRVGWHVAVDMPVADAAAVTGHLHRVPTAGE